MMCNTIDTSGFFSLAIGWSTIVNYQSRNSSNKTVGHPNQISMNKRIISINFTQDLYYCYFYHPSGRLIKSAMLTNNESGR